MNKLFSIILVCFLIVNSANSQWIPQQNTNTNTLYDVYFVNPNYGIAVGLFSTILKTTNAGVNWSTIPVNVGANLFGVAFANTNTGVVVGEGVYSRTTNGGANWTNITSPPAGLMYGAAFTNANTGFVCGSSGYIFRSTDGGATWNTLTSGTTEILNKLSFANTSTGYAAGHNGVILKTTNSGDNWTVQSSSISTNLTDVSAPSTDTAYISGNGGVIIKTTNGGANWIVQNTGFTNDFNSVFFSNVNTGSIVGYLIVLRTTNGGANWLPQDPGISGVGFTAVNFVNGTTGWAVGGNGAIITTITGGFPYPSAPNLVAPINGAANIPLTPLMQWDTSFSSKTYQLQIAADNAFGSPLIDTSNLGTTQLQVPPGILQNNVQYFWRVRGANIVGNGQWSSVYHFTTIVALPNPPTLLLPLNYAANVSLTPFFDWDSTSPAIYYKLQVSSDSLFANPEVNITGITFSSYTLTSPPLQSNTRYYWRVNTTNAAGTSAYSTVFRFTTIVTVPQAPILVAPPNNSGNVSLTPLLDWRDDITELSYQVQLSTDSLFTGTPPLIIDTSVNISQLSVRTGLLINLVKYYWRVRTTNPLGTGPWADPWNFLTGLVPPAAPVLIAPPDNDTDVSTILTFDWNDVFYASSYRIQVSTDSTFNTNVIINLGPLTISQYTNTGIPLNNNTLYYWHVNASNSAGTGLWSATRRFRTVISAPIAAPDLISPPNGSLVQTLTPTLDWNDVFQAADYKIQVSVDSLFTSPVIDSNVTPSQLTVHSGKLNGSSTYYWRVRSHNIGGYGPWSVIWNFTTSAIGITQISNIIPKDFNLYNNYPNPFNPSTKIRFDIPRTSNVKIEVYDLLGRKIATLLQMTVRAGTYETSWNTTNEASGIYLYRIETSNYVKTKKMVLIK